MDTLKNKLIEELHKYCDSLLEYDWNNFFSYVEPYIDRIVNYLLIISTDETVKNSLKDRYIKMAIPLAHNDKLVIKMNSDCIEFAYQPNLMGGN